MQFLYALVLVPSLFYLAWVWQFRKKVEKELDDDYVFTKPSEAEDKLCFIMNRFGIMKLVESMSKIDIDKQEITLNTSLEVFSKLLFVKSSLPHYFFGIVLMFIILFLGSGYLLAISIGIYFCARTSLINFAIKVLITNPGLIAREYIKKKQ